MVRHDDKERVGSEMRIGRNLMGREGNRKEGKGKGKGMIGEIDV